MSHNLGIVTGPDGTMRIFPGLVRIPDVALVSWARIPGGAVPEEPIPDLVPDVAVEVFSTSNTEAEMRRKRREFFAAGVRLVWVVYPKTRAVAVYTTVDNPTIVVETETLDAGEALPALRIS